MLDLEHLNQKYTEIGIIRHLQPIEMQLHYLFQCFFLLHKLRKIICKIYSTVCSLYKYILFVKNYQTIYLHKHFSVSILLFKVLFISVHIFIYIYAYKIMKR